MITAATVNGLPVAPADFPASIDWADMRRGGRRLILVRKSLPPVERAAVLKEIHAATAS